jgi:cellulose synthase/poly-beta-1,6-N-acetylglucosamine synthase-like glycosyltransferase
MYTLLLLFGFLAVLGLLILSTLFLYGYYKNHNKDPPDFHPNVCVIVPCKGKEQNLEQNLEALCTQHYSNYTVIFVVDSEHDAAYPSVSRIVQKFKNSRIEFSTKLEGCSGKISALLTGIKKAGDVAVYVFADSDVCPHKEWLSNLVAYLYDENIGAATGFRWYFPHSWTSSLISTWNMAPMSALFYPSLNYAWGGSTAIRTSLFKKLDIESKWRAGFSDDLMLTKAVKNAGYRIKFVPQCIVESPSEVHLLRFLHWGSQQLTWVKWYTPFFWLFYFAGIVFLQCLTIFGFLLVGMGVTIPGLLMVSALFFEMIYGLVGILVLKRLMGYPKEKFRFVWRYALLMPVVFFLFAYNALASSVKQQIVWGGRTYRKRDAVR